MNTHFFSSPFSIVFMAFFTLHIHTYAVYIFSRYSLLLCAFTIATAAGVATAKLLEKIIIAIIPKWLDGDVGSCCRRWVVFSCFYLLLYHSHRAYITYNHIHILAIIWLIYWCTHHNHFKYISYLSSGLFLFLLSFFLCMSVGTHFFGLILASYLTFLLLFPISFCLAFSFASLPYETCNKNLPRWRSTRNSHQFTHRSNVDHGKRHIYGKYKCIKLNLGAEWEKRENET